MAQRISFKELHTFVKATLEASGLNALCAERVADGLVEASERGVDTHGIALLQHYVINLDGGGVNKTPIFKFHDIFGTMSVLDADHGFGLSAGYAAVHHAAAIARKHGMAAVCIRNSTHCGAMAAFTLRGARLGFITVASTNTDPRMMSTAGMRPYFGTNPIAVAAPRTGGAPPFSYDAATTAIPFNKVMVARRAGKGLPEGLAADEDGHTTLDAEKAVQLHSFGGYKGFGLSAVVEVLTGVMNAMPFARHFSPMYGPGSRADDKRNISQFILLMRPDAVDTVNEAFATPVTVEEATAAATNGGTGEHSAEGVSAIQEAAAAWLAGEGPAPHGCGTIAATEGSAAASAGDAAPAGMFERAKIAAYLADGTSDDGVPVWARGTFQDRMWSMTQSVRSEPAAAAGAMGPNLAVTGGGGPAGVGVQLAGDPQERFQAERQASGIPIPPETVAIFAALTKATGVAPTYI